MTLGWSHIGHWTLFGFRFVARGIISCVEGAVAYRLMREKGGRWLGRQTKAAAVGGATVVTVVVSLQQDRCRVAVEG